MAKQLLASQEQNLINFVVQLLREILTLRKTPARNLICGDNYDRLIKIIIKKISFSS
jgi:hypothetical protein